jgi:hypothetical protein
MTEESQVNRLTCEPSVVAPKVSVVLLDWSVRESLHSLTYLNQQREPRENYELIWIEYYGRRLEQLTDSLAKDSPTRIDQWIVLGMPERCYYHKHMMYNIGIAVSRSDIVCICDSDAIFNETFIDRVISTFAENDRIVLHIDEVRNNDKRFYPFSYPTISEVLGPGAINWHNGKTTGLWDKADPLHTRNYGACFCAKRAELISIGGADEHIGFVGHVCGPYDMTFRLVNNGCREIWHETEYIYHTWHPGQAGDQNLLGPHDGRHVSSIALNAATEGRVMPLKENAAIAALRQGEAPSAAADVIELGVDPTYAEALVEEQLEQTPIFKRWQHLEFIASLKEYRYNVIRLEDKYFAVPWNLGELDAGKIATVATRLDVFSGETADSVREQVVLRAGEANGQSRINQLIASSSRFFRKILKRIGRSFFHG